jgi:hypothetical protein
MRYSLNNGITKEQIERIEHEMEEKWKSHFTQKQQEIITTLKKYH